MLDVLLLGTTIRIVPRILTSLLISVAAAATWPNVSLVPPHQVLLLWPLISLGLYSAFLLIHPRWAHVLSGVLVSVGMAGLAVSAGLPGSEVLGTLASFHPAWITATIVQAAVWWTEADAWQTLTG